MSIIPFRMNPVAVPPTYGGQMLAHFDAINNTGTNVHSNSQTIWKDLMGNYDVDLTANIALNTVKWYDNYLDFYGTHQQMILFNNQQTTLGLNGFAIESITTHSRPYGAYKGIAGDHGKYRTWGALHGQSDNNNVAFGIIGDFGSHYGYMHIPVSVYSTYSTLPIHICMTTDTSAIKFYVNGVFKGQHIHTTGYALGSAINFYFGSGYPDPEPYGHRNFNGRMHSLRIYNKGLTDFERIRNFSIDKDRYGINTSLNIPATVY